MDLSRGDQHDVAGRHGIAQALHDVFEVIGHQAVQLEEVVLVGRTRAGAGIVVMKYLKIIPFHHLSVVKGIQQTVHRAVTPC